MRLNCLHGTITGGRGNSSLLEVSDKFIVSVKWLCKRSKLLLTNWIACTAEHVLLFMHVLLLIINTELACFMFNYKYRRELCASEKTESILYCIM